MSAESDDHYAYSKLTDTWYRVFDYEHVAGDKIVANGKEEVPRSEVPDDVLARTDDRPYDAEDTA